MKKIKILLALLTSVSVIQTANAWYTAGYIYCDANANGVIDPGDTPISGVRVQVINGNQEWSAQAISGTDGYFFMELRDYPDTYTETLDPSTLPADAVIIQPPGGKHVFTLTDVVKYFEGDFLVRSSTCLPPPEEPGGCWMTGGGVKFEPLTGTMNAQRGSKVNFGGNVFPGCSPTAGDGGNWNHIDHAKKLHFQGRVVTTVSCGNVVDHPPGSESPVTPFNYIEYEGTGTLRGIKGNKVNFGTVYFRARVEDRNEPGSKESNGGAFIDRYFLQVFTNPANPAGTTKLLFDVDGDPATVDPILITGGNLQLHISSCDDPPTP